jgi:hypothetical protein
LGRKSISQAVSQAVGKEKALVMFHFTSGREEEALVMFYITGGRQGKSACDVPLHKRS